MMAPYVFSDTLARKAAEDYFRTFTRIGGFGTGWLYFKPSAGAVPGELRVIVDGEDATGWTLADPQAIRGNLTIDQAACRFREVARRLPILPTEGGAA
jgi:hypothetical protein